MNIQITSLNIAYQNEEISNVKVYFSGYDEDRTVNVNGHVTLTAEEYEGNESLVALEGIIRQYVSGKIQESI